jgi:hypothetical protein
MLGNLADGARKIALVAYRLNCDKNREPIERQRTGQFCKKTEKS